MEIGKLLQNYKKKLCQLCYLKDLMNINERNYNQVVNSQISKRKNYSNHNRNHYEREKINSNYHERTCYICNKRGHIAKNCKYNKYNENKRNSENKQKSNHAHNVVVYEKNKTYSNYDDDIRIFK